MASVSLRSKRAFSRVTVLAALVASGLSIAAISFSDRLFAQPAVPSSLDLLMLMSGTELTPTNLAAAGVHPSTVALLVADMREHASNNWTQLGRTFADGEGDAVPGNLAGAFAAATARLNEGQRLTLARLRENQQWELPTEYLVVQRSEAEWVRLRNALAAERIVQRTGNELPEEFAETLAAARSDISFTTAAANLQANLAAVQQAWDLALAN